MRFGRIRFIVVIMAVILLSGCGKSIPVIDSALLENKSSVLLVTEQGLPAATKQKLQKALLDWRDKKQTSFEWMEGADGLSEQQWAQIRQRGYDYIILTGHQLVKSTLPEAEQLQTSKWIMLDDQVTRDGMTVKGQHITLLHADDARLHAEWDEWVRQQQVSGRTIEWVTTSAYPVSSDWAPEEEAEYVTLADADGWFTQLQFQVKSHNPAWVAAYSSLDASQIQRLRSLQVPVVNMMKTTMELQWEQLLPRLSDWVSNKNWSPGIKPYENAEIKMNKNF